MPVGKHFRISVSVDREGSAIMCHHTPCSKNCGSDGMAVDLSLCSLPTTLPLVLPKKLSSNSKTTQNALEYRMEESDIDLRHWPSPIEIVREMGQLASIGGPMVVLGMLLYLRAMISMLFLGRIGGLELAGGSLSIGFANITGYSVLAGLSMGMEPICGQAFGAKKWEMLGVTLQRTVLVMFCACLPITILWMNMHRILTFCGQDAGLVVVAHTFLLFSLPDLAAQAFLNPLRIYLRSQQITKPLTYCAFLALSLHVPINMLLVDYFGLSVKGVALATACTDFNLLSFIMIYLLSTGRYKRTWSGFSKEALREWGPLLSLAIPSCISVCLEWWWYELMIILSGLLVNAQATVASMGILIQTTALVYIFPSALGLAVSTRVGNELGANHPGRARISMLVALGCAGVVAILACTFTTSMRHIWGTMFTSDPKILALTSLVLPIVGLCELGNCPQTTGCGVLRGCARPSTGANINLGSFYLVGMPVALILGFWLDFGFVGLWFGLLAAQSTCAMLMLTILLRTDWVKQAQRAKDLTTESSAKVAPADDEECLMRKAVDEATTQAEDEKTALISIKVDPNMADDT